MATLSTYKPAIIIPAYKRDKSLLRLLHSINEANFSDQDIRVIISVDGDPNPDVISVAKNFSFKSGTVEVIEHDKNLGLYRHILECADYSAKYESVLILEDDLVVGPAFYEYAQRALSYYDENESISGIALYSQRFNETALLPFEPLNSEWPVYFMQLGCSWGQAWTKRQWNDFKNWHLQTSSNATLDKPEIPKNIQKWAESSWKKHYNHYLIEQNKYMVYPYNSFTTNCTDSVGSHMKYLLNTFQVPLNMSESLGDGFQFSEFNENSIRYDSFMESKSKMLERWFGLPLEEVEVDLYGSKPVEVLQKKKYAVTVKEGENPIRSFPLSFRPIELNLKYETHHKDNSFLHLFKSKDVATNHSLADSIYYQLAEYFLYIPIESRRFASLYFKEFLKSLIGRFKNLFLSK